MRLTVDRLACRRSGRLIFQDLSFALGGGEAIAVTGRNGAGKSSLLAILAGRLRAESGAVAAEGIGERGLAECLHLVGHRDGLKTALTAAENLVFARDLLGDGMMPPAEALAAVGLAHAARDSGRLPVGRTAAPDRVGAAPRRPAPALAPRRAGRCPRRGRPGDPRARSCGGTSESGGLIVAATHQPLGVAARELRIAALRCGAAA